MAVNHEMSSFRSSHFWTVQNSLNSPTLQIGSFLPLEAGRNGKGGPDLVSPNTDSTAVKEALWALYHTEEPVDTTEADVLKALDEFEAGKFKSPKPQKTVSSGNAGVKGNSSSTSPAAPKV